MHEPENGPQQDENDRRADEHSDQIPYNPPNVVSVENKTNRWSFLRIILITGLVFGVMLIGTVIAALVLIGQACSGFVIR